MFPKWNEGKAERGWSFHVGAWFHFAFVWDLVSDRIMDDRNGSHDGPQSAAKQVFASSATMAVSNTTPPDLLVVAITKQQN